MDDKKQKQLKVGAKVCLIVLLIASVRQFISVYQIHYMLDSPLIPKDTIWQISKQYIFIAFIMTVSCMIGLALYFYNKYLWIITLTVLTLIGSRFVYLPLS
jgi:hypothetical protein